MIYKHNIDPVMINIMGLDIYYYGVAYFVAILLASMMFNKYLFRDKKLSESFCTYIVFGVLLGGRLGYVIFYDLSYYISHPINILNFRMGGMSFHGGLLGVILAMFIFCKRNQKNFFMIADFATIVAPIGLFFGRIANFINGELYGRQTDGSWGVFFPAEPFTLRHPSQLYEAFGEGILLFLIMLMVAKFKYSDKALMDKCKNYGIMSSLFIIFYGVIRFIIEFYREPDVQKGFIFGNWMTMGQVLCIAMVIFGAGLMVIRVCISRKSK
jgi:phosphatidylglycerol:prolipoprotein diacylglycerol transferase